MQILTQTDYFIPADYIDPLQRRTARLLVRASLLTSLFSSTYVGLSYLFSYEKGIYFMLFNVIGFFIIPFLVKARTPLRLAGNLYITIGATAIVVLIFFSGGLWSAIYPWIISIPILALLVVGKRSAVVWGAISFMLMIGFGIIALQGIELPVEYNVALKTQWYVSILPGLLLILLVISFVFEHTQSKALQDLEKKNELLELQKETINRQRVELEKYVEEKDQIIGILAHDLKNPLFNISSLNKFLREDPDSAERDKYIELIRQSSSNALDLIDQVLKMNAAENKALPLKLEKIKIEMLLREVLSLLTDIADKKNISIQLTNDSSMDEVESDKTYLKLIFENLVSNALKFSHDGMNVVIKISPLPDKLQIAVIDEGPGIKAKEEQLLFKKFTRLSARPTAGESSTGLGLSLVKHYVEILKGEVLYRKNEGSGATFIVLLPHQFQLA